RLTDALTNNYDGMRMDFAYDDLELNWISNSKVSETERSIHDNLPTLVDALLDDLRTNFPTATLVFNGYFVADDPTNYDTYLTNTTGGEYEFFAYSSNTPDATAPLSTSGEALLGLIDDHNLGKWSVASAGGSIVNLAARFNSLALHLLVANSQTYYYYNPGSLSQEIPYYPEWGVQLGDPILEITSSSQLTHVSGALARGISGTGYVPELGGNGKLIYVKLDSGTLSTEAAAIIVRVL
ncbi:hypothetical protein LCGC14_2692640, partial [marine sediment metagenome]